MVIKNRHINNSNKSIHIKRKPKVILIMPGRNVAKTIKKVVAEIPRNIVSKVILIDDGSEDKTAQIAESLGIKVFSHPKNIGYGGAQKTGYWEAMKENPDVIVMAHADFQHDIKYIDRLIEPILERRFDVMFGSRLSNLSWVFTGGMPKIKYLVNRSLTLIENIILKVDLTEHLCGFRAYSFKALKHIPFQRFSNGYDFDSQFEISAIARDLKIGEIPIPTRYLKEAGSISLLTGVKLTIDIFKVLFKFILFKLRIYRDPIFND